MELFNKSRAQEAKAQIERLVEEIMTKEAVLSAMREELKERCPHPDEYVVKLQNIRTTGTKRSALYACKLCGQTKTERIK
jgi:hypothetical protein